jgi:hypothetical protein
VSLNILFLATKAPWPADDGSRLLTRLTLEGLAERGHRITLVAPVEAALQSAAQAALAEICTPRLVAAQRKPLWQAYLFSRLRGRPYSIERHQLPAVARAVEGLLKEQAFDVVHVEQVQALAQAEPALRRSVPVVLRAQNVESDLWAALASVLPVGGFLAASEARRLARWEGRSVARVATTVALTTADAARLRELAGGQGRLEVIRAPFPAQLPAAEEALAGHPAVTLLGSGWLPNQDSNRWFVRQVWPAVRARLPQAQLHLFGPWHRSFAAEGIQHHAPPPDSRSVFAPGSILVVPLRIASGVRMKILEAWARGIPVVASPEAASGLEAQEGVELLLAQGPEDFATAFQRLFESQVLLEGVVQKGREALLRYHDLTQASAKLATAYEFAQSSTLSGAGFET